MQATVPTQEQVTALESAGLVTVRPHKFFPLRIVNYTPRAQYERAWTPELVQCRGLVYDDQWNLVARPFPKFFNYEEHLGADPVAGPLPAGPYTVTEKFDGSLGIVFRWQDEVLLATRGSFHSEQAEHGTDILYRYMIQLGWRFPEEGFTHLFEIIYPANRIVVDYGSAERLQHLATIENATGEEMASMLGNYGEFSLLPASTPEDLKRMQVPNREGYVLRYANGQRVKIKFDQYVELHRLVTGSDSVSIWECLRNGQDPLATLTSLPDELYGWAEQTKTQLLSEYANAVQQTQEQYRSILLSLGTAQCEVPSRKDFAALAVQQEHPQLLFMLLDGNQAKLNDAVWKLIKPERAKPVTAEEC